MMKKSNKTTHVLNLITNRTGIPAEELEQAAAPPHQAPAAPAPLAAYPGVEVKKFFNLSISDKIRENLEKVHIREVFEREEARKTRVIEPYTPESFDEPEEAAVEEEPEVEEEAEAEVEEEPAVAIEEKPPAIEEKPAVQKCKDDDGQSMDGYILVNILEEVIRLEAPRIMAGLKMCCCERCVNDVMALALNGIPAKYVVSRKGALFAKIASYGMQYKTDILSSVTQACMVVEKSPSHS